MNAVSICMISIIGVITFVMVKSYKQEFGIVIIVVLSMLFLGWMIEIFTQMQSQVAEIALDFKGNRSFYKILFKIMGITYLCELSSGICKDAGVSSVAAQIEIMGKMLVLLSGIPIIVSVIEIIGNYEI